MPVFKVTENAPDIELANIDKIRVLIKRAYRISFANIDQYNAFKSLLANDDLFTQGFGAQSSIFKIKGNGRLGLRWLFGGSVTLMQRQSHPDCIVKLDLIMNPSRLAHYQSCALEGVEDIIGRLRASSAIDVMEKPVEIIDPPKSLDRNDNYIPARRFRDMRPATDLMDVYLDKTLELIKETLEKRSEGLDAEIEELLTDWSIPYSEIYWEYSVSDAISFINGLRAYVEPQFSNSEFLEYNLSREQDPEYDGSDMSWSIVRNAPCLKLNPGSKNVEYAIYAKELGRVRFEVRYKSNLRSQLNLNARRNLSERVRGISTLLEPAIVNAQKRLKKLFSTLPDLDYSERCDFHEFTELLANLAEACHEERSTGLQRLIAMLASNARIEVALDSPDSRLCRTLVDQGILSLARGARNIRGHRLYILNVRYANVLTAIQKEFSLPAQYASV